MLLPASAVAMGILFGCDFTREPPAAPLDAAAVLAQLSKTLDSQRAAITAAESQVELLTSQVESLTQEAPRVMPDRADRDGRGDGPALAALDTAAGLYTLLEASMTLEAGSRPLVTEKGAFLLSAEGTRAEVVLNGRAAADLEGDPDLRNRAFEYLGLSLERHRLREAYAAARLERGEFAQAGSEEELERFFQREFRGRRMPEAFLVRGLPEGGFGIIDLKPFQKATEMFDRRLVKVRLALQRQGCLPHFYLDGQEREG